MKKVYLAALRCWLVPLVIGLVIFGLYLYSQTQGTGSPILMLAGLTNILFGTFCAIMGMCEILHFMVLGYRDTEYPRLRLWGHAAVAALLLCSNFGVVYGMVAYSRYIDRTRYSVFITNSTAQTLEQVHVTGAGYDVDYGSISPNVVVSHPFWISNSGNLEVQTSGPNIATTLIGPVEPGQAGSVTIEFNQNGAEVKNYDGVGRSFRDIFIPEPSTYAFTAGIAVLGFAAWQRRQKAVARV